MLTKKDATETIAEAVRRQLLDEILFGAFKAPARLFPAELAARLGVSVTPVREALASLASQGLVEAVPRYGYHVRVPTSEDIEHLWQIRLALELMAGELIIRRFPNEVAREQALKPVARLCEQMRHSPKRTHHKHITLNSQFHETLVEISGNPLISNTYASIGVRVMSAWVQRGTVAWKKRLDVGQTEHEAILRSLYEGDFNAYESVVRQHISRSLKDALSDIQDVKRDEENVLTAQP